MSSNKRVKHVATGKEHGTRKKSLKRGSSSMNAQVEEEENMSMDPRYTPEAQEARMVKFASRKSMFIRYADSEWLENEGFEFPALLATQGVTDFIELQGNIYTNLVREFYANFLYRDDTFMTMVRGVRIILDDSLFRNVTNMTSEGASITDYTDDRWNGFDAIEFYKTCLRDENLYVPGTLKKVGLFTVENRLLHYALVYLLVPRKSNNAQPNDVDMKYMYAIKNGIVINWPSVILALMYDVSGLKGTKPLAYGIFISRIIDHIGIDTTGQEIQNVTESKHFFGESIIHQMQIYKRGGQWIHQQEQEAVDLDMEEEQQAQDPQDAENVPRFGVAHLDAMEQRINERIDMRFQTLEDLVNTRTQGMEDRLTAKFEDALRLQGEAMQANFDRMNFIMQTLGGFNQPPQPPNP